MDLYMEDGMDVCIFVTHITPNREDTLQRKYNDICSGYQTDTLISHSNDSIASP